ncbi:hypothetical protein L6452_44448 [Arctium lappa]|uniref:Uncharacterized protein n=1 Tax=Arctium lappa TaxID=4217 RepID=A0ACB8XGF4_ARCLA|nr:hypothetical protein L6452_44448 [Arctium lappa]
MTIHGSRNIFTYVLHILLLSSIILIMMMINHCHGSPSSSFNYKYAPDHCNGTLAECPTSLLEEDDGGEEFLMDTEEHRRILQGQRRHISTDALQRPPVGLVHEDCIAKMRLMSMMDLASDESGQIPYRLIKDTLQIEDDEVEPWVVKAITAKLIDCKIDQMNQVIRVSRYTERVFGPRQWQALREKLATWRGSIANVITTIQANKVTEEGTQGMQGLAIR